MAKKIKIKYDFKSTFPIPVSVQNTLMAGSVVGQTAAASTSITDKKFINETSVIIELIGTTQDVTFTRCLFVGCSKILLTAVAVGTISFVDCTFIDNVYIIDTGTLANGNGDVEFSNCIVYRNTFIATALDTTFINGEPSVYTDFYNCPNVVYNDSTYEANPLFIDEVNFYLMSIARDYPFDSPLLAGKVYHDSGSGLVGSASTGLGAGTYDLDITINGGTLRQLSVTIAGTETFDDLAALLQTELQLVETGFPEVLIEDGTLRAYGSTVGSDSVVLMADGTAGNTPLLTALSISLNSQFTDKDQGCYIERRSAFPQFSNSEVLISAVCDFYSKKRILTEFNQFLNESGDLVQYWNFGQERKGFIMKWTSNGLTETELSKYVDMILAKSDVIYVYPDADDPNKYAICQIYKKKEYEYSRKSNQLDERGTISKVKYNSIEIPVVVTSEVGSWLP